MKTIAHIFLTGLLFFLPLIVTVSLLYWLFVTAENLLKIPLQWMLPSGWYITGMGVVSGFALICSLGILVQTYIIKHLFASIENSIERIPVVKTLYSSAKELLMFFAGSGEQQNLSRVVRVTFDNELHMIGFVTNEDASVGDLDDLIAVYLPLSYQIGGFLVYMPKSRCEVLDIPVNKAMQQVLTAHVKRSDVKT